MDVGQVLSEASLQCRPHGHGTIDACEDNCPPVLFFPIFFAHLFLKEGDLQHWDGPQRKLAWSTGMFFCLVLRLPASLLPKAPPHWGSNQTLRKIGLCHCMSKLIC